MNPLLLWLTSAVLGMAAAMLTGMLGLGATAIALILATPLIVRGDRLVAISGLLVGFGGLWLFGLGLQSASGGALRDSEVWISVGAAPLILGSVALGLRLLRTRRVRFPHRE